MKFEYTGSFIRIVLEIFHRRPRLARHPLTWRRKHQQSRRELLSKVIHKIGETSV